jgi:hypothetical protein
MRAIIIGEDRFAEIAELMKLEAMNMADRATTAERLGGIRMFGKRLVMKCIAACIFTLLDGHKATAQAALRNSAD